MQKGADIHVECRQAAQTVCLCAVGVQGGGINLLLYSHKFLALVGCKT